MFQMSNEMVAVKATDWIIVNKRKMLTNPPIAPAKNVVTTPTCNLSDTISNSLHKTYRVHNGGIVVDLNDIPAQL